MEDIFRVLQHLDQPGKKVLATITHVDGSSYKKEGSSMLFFDNGDQAGMVTAGCLEAELALQAEKIFHNGKAVVLQYDMREETDLDWGAGCNGILEILLEPLNPRLSSDWLIARGYLEANKAVQLKRNLGHPEEYLFTVETGEIFGNWRENTEVDICCVTGKKPEEKSIWQYLYRPQPRLFIFGAGADAIPLVSLAAETGFHVTVCDWREGLCREKNFPDASRLCVGFPSKVADKISVSPEDFVVIMSHHFQRDQEFLSAILQNQVKYLGVLGPRERTGRLLKGNDIPGWISSPAGKAIGARGPVEIAVSIVAELIEAWRTPVQDGVKNIWTIPR